MSRLKENVAAGIAGLIFGLGLVFTGMTQPQKVVGFLDLFGSWDPSLAFVMGGAVTFHLVTFHLVRRRQTPLFVNQWHVPTKTKITNSLMIGAILFGAGWGLSGFCPGPAITALVSLEPSVFIFVGSMLSGMVIFKILDKKLKLNR